MNVDETSGNGTDSLADNTGGRAQNSTNNRARKGWEDRPATYGEGCGPEPLDDTPDCYALHEPIAADASLVDKERYLADDGEPMTHIAANQSYIRQRHSEGTTATRHGFVKGRQYRAQQQYRRGMAIDRQLLARYETPTTVLLSLRMSPTVEGRLTLLTALKTAADKTIDQVRYRLQNAPDAPFSADEWEYIAVFAGTEKRATPHLHIYIWVDGACDRDLLTPVVEKFVSECEFAPDAGTGNDPQGGTIKVRGNGTDTVPHVDKSSLNPTDCVYDGSNNQGAVYTLTQLPHLRDVDEMAQDELLHSATTDAWRGRPYRASMSESDISDQFWASAPVSSTAEPPKES